MINPAELLTAPQIRASRTLYNMHSFYEQQAARRTDMITIQEGHLSLIPDGIIPLENVFRLRESQDDIVGDLIIAVPAEMLIDGLIDHPEALPAIMHTLAEELGQASPFYMLTTLRDAQATNPGAVPELALETMLAIQQHRGISIFLRSLQVIPELREHLLEASVTDFQQLSSTILQGKFVQAEGDLKAFLAQHGYLP